MFLHCVEFGVYIRDRSFFMRKGGLVGFGGGGPLKKIGLKGGVGRKKMKEKGGWTKKLD